MAKAKGKAQNVSRLDSANMKMVDKPTLNLDLSRLQQLQSTRSTPLGKDSNTSRSMLLHTQTRTSILSEHCQRMPLLALEKSKAIVVSREATVTIEAVTMAATLEEISVVVETIPHEEEQEQA